MLIKKNLFYFFIIFKALLILDLDLYACASCGSGSGDPLYLAPNEKLKSIISARTSYIPKTIRVDGLQATNHLVKRKNFMDLGLSYRFSSKVNAGIFTGIQQNSSYAQTQSGLLEPLLAARYTLINQNFLRPSLPQVQLLASFKPRLNKDKFESNSQQMLDVFGSGFNEFSLGYDVWNAMNRIYYGWGQRGTFSLQKTINNTQMRPGESLSSIATMGIPYFQTNKILFGYINNKKYKRLENSKRINLSDSLDHGLFTGIDYMLLHNVQLRATYASNGLWNSYNTTKSQSLTLSLISRWI